METRQVMYVLHNIEAHSLNHCCCEKLWVLHNLRVCL